MDEEKAQEMKKEEKAAIRHDRPEAKPSHDEQNQKLLEMSEISLWLDTYDDIFSDFDPRPYSQRALSEDFLWEARRASRDKVSGGIEIKFLVPAAMRNSSHESLIRKRLREHFSKHQKIAVKEVRDMIRHGIYFAVTGAVIMLFASYLLFEHEENSFIFNFLITLMEPAGWFFFWEGLRQAVFESKVKKPDAEFYRKMADCEITFTSY